jgi:hypothetical protein
MSEWENFLLAEVGASAALAGLIFVAVSINLNRIISIPKLPNRAFESLLVLLTVLIVSSLLLVPGQSISIVGVEVLVIGFLVWIMMIFNDVKIWQNTETVYKGRYILLIFFNQLTMLPYLVAGVILFFTGLIGLYWLVPAVIFSFIKALADAWVLLIEINR